MNARHALIIAVSCVSFGSVAIAADSRTTQSQPPPSTTRQPTAPPPSKPAPPPNTSTTSSRDSKPKGSSSSTTGGSSSTTGGDSRRGSDRRNDNYPRDRYGRPITGVYYPGQYGDGNNPNNPTSPSSSSSSSPQSSPTAPTTMPADSTASSDSGSTASWRTTPTTDKKGTAVVTAPDPELAAATAELNTAMDEVRQSLQNNPDYQAALADKETSKAEAAALHARTDATPEEALPIAQRGLVASRKLQQIEHDAAVKDPKVQAARARLDAAIAGHASKAADLTAAAK